MKIVNFGSLNLDNVYRVAKIVRPGETISSKSVETHCGGKGLNQSLALAKSGMQVYHAGMVGKEDGQTLVDVLQSNGVNTKWIEFCEGKSGHCIIQVDDGGQNSIVLCSGANGRISEKYVCRVLGSMREGELLLIQNEISGLEQIIKTAKEHNLYIILNPSPINQKLLEIDLSAVQMFILNEVEGSDLTGGVQTDQILKEMKKKYPNAEIVLTLGKAGSIYSGKYGEFRQDAYSVSTVDTTAAGDTFTGYFIREYFNGNDVRNALQIAACASAIAVTKPGAADSIPFREEVLNWREEIK